MDFTFSWNSAEDLDDVTSLPGIYSWYGVPHPGRADYAENVDSTGRDEGIGTFVSFLQRHTNRLQRPDLAVEARGGFWAAWEGELREVGHPRLAQAVEAAGDDTGPAKLSTALATESRRRILAMGLQSAAPVAASPLYIGVAFSLADRLSSHMQWIKKALRAMDVRGEVPEEWVANHFGARAVAHGFLPSTLWVGTLSLEYEGITPDELRESIEALEWLLNRWHRPLLGEEMNMVKFGSQAVTFQNKVLGTWGEFTSGGGSIRYVMTNARLGTAGTDLEFRLTSHLRPVREILDVSDMDFNELLQRDLDDHRVATELIPYVLGLQSTLGEETSSGGPSFFPPILAFLLPFTPQGDLDEFPAASPSEVIDTDVGEMLEERRSDAYRVRRAYSSQTGAFAPEKFGTLEWNNERARLVVLDGQHRAMALLAIDRTLRNTWEHSDVRAARYAPFYKMRVEMMLEQAGVRERLGGLQLPVTVCWFAEPDKPLEDARKLFVDVNKNARPPSQARLVLLSDSELTNILTRTVLNELRAGSASSLPLYAIEYDNPDPSRSTRPARWSTLVTIDLLTTMVDKLVLGDPKYIKHVDREMRGRENVADRNARLREQLRVSDYFLEQIHDDGSLVERGRISNTYFPSTGVEKMEDAFLEGWGRALITILSELAPYRAHCQALAHLENEWPKLEAGIAASLAHEAVFEGVGLYWTLKNNAEYFRKIEARQIEAQTGAKPKKGPDTVAAWNLITEKEAEFKRLRAERYLGVEYDVDAVNQLYDVALTHACILGLTLTYATIVEDQKARGPDVASLAGEITAAFNRCLEAEAPRGGTRKTYLLKSSDQDLTINTISQMNTARSMQFRYFWFEALAALAPHDVLFREINRERLLERRDESRKIFVQYRAKEQQQQLYKSDTSRPRAEYYEAAQKKVLNELQRALGDWFGVNDSEFLDWLKSYPVGQTTYEEEEEEDELIEETVSDIEG